MSEWFRYLRAAWRGRRVSRLKPGNPRVTLESFEKVKLVPFEDSGERDRFFLSASALDHLLRNDAEPN
jgi:hypothetical protein